MLKICSASIVTMEANHFLGSTLVCMAGASQPHVVHKIVGNIAIDVDSFLEPPTNQVMSERGQCRLVFTGLREKVLPARRRKRTA